MNHKQAIIYCRYSPRPDASACKSNAGQRGRCETHCTARGYEVLHSFEDANISGRTRNRPQLNAAIESLRPGMVLVVDRNDRLARDMLVALSIHHDVEKAGCTVEFADGSPLRSTPEGELLSNVLTAFAQYERRVFSNRTKAGLKRKREAGVWCGRPPYGWKKLPGIDYLCQNVEEQERIDEMLQMEKLGKNAEYICRVLDSTASLCQGKPWSARTIRRILARERKNVEK